MRPTSIYVYTGRMVPPLERIERREEPKAQGGEFVEAYVASEDAKNPLKAREQKGIQGYGLLYPPGRKG